MDGKNYIYKIFVYELEITGLRVNSAVFKSTKYLDFFQKCSESAGIFNFDTSKYITPGSVALNLFIDTCNQHGYKIKLDASADICSDVRNSHIGGRNEYIAHPKSGCVYSVDFNLMYFSCMKEKFPTNKFIKTYPTKIDGPGFYKVTFASKNMRFPVLPFCNRFTREIFFCNGRHTDIYWYEEIVLFLEEGGEIEKIHCAYVPEDYVG